jgi:peroxiredoxin
MRRRVNTRGVFFLPSVARCADQDPAVLYTVAALLGLRAFDLLALLPAGLATLCLLFAVTVYADLRRLCPPAQRLCGRPLCSTIPGMRGMGRVAGTIRVGLLMAVLVSGALEAAALEVGAKAPPFANPDLQNRYVMSRDLLGKGWVILDFFATDCEGCKKELPILERLQADYGGAGLSVLVFATDAEGARVVEPFLGQRPTSLPIVLDRYQVTSKKYGVTEIPSLFLVDPAGEIAFVEVGFREDLYEALSAILEADR